MKTKLNKQKIVDKYIGTIINYSLIPFKNLKNKKFKNATIIIYKLDAIGDAVLSLPMIKHLKEQTEFRIIIACSNTNKVIFQNHKFIDKIVIFDTSKLNLKNLIQNIKTLREEKAVITLDTSQSSNISAIFTFFTAEKSIGFKKTKGKSRNYVYNTSINLDPNKHMIHNYFDLIKSLVINPPKKVKLIKLLCSEKKGWPSIIIHPCTNIPQKVWPQGRWVKVIEYLAKKNKLSIIGSKEESPLVKKLLKKVRKKVKKNIINLSGRMELNELISVINRTKLFVGNDGGPMHISACMQKPTIGLFGYETPVRYAPFNKKSISIYKNLPCSPCMKAYNNEWPDCINPICMKQIQVDEVIKSIKKLI